MSDSREKIEVLRAHMATSRKVQRISITLAAMCIVLGFIAGRWNGVVSFVVVTSSIFTIFIAAYITGMRILMFKHEIRTLEEAAEKAAEDTPASAG